MRRRRIHACHMRRRIRRKSDNSASSAFPMRRRRIHACHMRRRIRRKSDNSASSAFPMLRRIYACHMRKRRNFSAPVRMGKEEEDTCMSYEEEVDTQKV
jgi:hypothetical protein